MARRRLDGLHVQLVGQGHDDQVHRWVGAHGLDRVVRAGIAIARREVVPACRVAAEARRRTRRGDMPQPLVMELADEARPQHPDADRLARPAMA